ncbi:MAG: SDR family oxidoreductase [Candidatus Symbiobacter sp.]|nr:SDR family oxidoreductase [Candidatus Symbiobacter sp.]
MNYTLYHDLAGKTVFISGGSSGIGAELVRAFAAQNCRVAFCGTKPNGGDELFSDITQAGLPRPHYYPCDVRDIAALTAMLDEIGTTLGNIGVLINNAGRDDRHSLDELTPEYWDNCLNTNLRHQVFATQIVARQMKLLGGGAIINMGSISWMRGRPHLIGYTTSKAAISGMTRTLARELGEFNIRVNAIVPGAIVTPRQSELWRNPAEDQKFIEFQCLKFRLEATHVAAPTLFLASTASLGITGHNLIVDAGLAQVSIAG